MIVEMIVTLAFLAIPFSIGYQTGRKNLIYKENEGEKKVRITLQSIEEHGYHLKNNITIPTTNGSTQIDHILFSRKGIFIIETKDYKGWIYGNEKQHKWTQTFKNSQKKYKFLNPLLQNNGHIYHLNNVVGISKEWIISIVVFTNSEVEIKTNLPNNVVKLNDLVKYISQFNNDILDENQVYEAIGKIEYKRSKRSNKVDEEHIEYIQSKYKQ